MIKNPEPVTGLPAPGDWLFAYGTLKTGGRFHSLLEGEGICLVGPGRLVTAYPLVLAEYPCLLDRSGQGHRVRGEVYRIDDPLRWLALDRLEDHPNEYLRRIETVEVHGRLGHAWVYFYQWVDRLPQGLRAVDEFSPRAGEQR